MKKLVLLFFCFAFFSFQTINSIFFVPKNWPQPHYNFKNNKLDSSKILLGRVLFYDPILSANNTISCANCHSPFSAFTHIDHPLSHGIFDSIGNRNSIALMNLAWQNTFMWDGSINHLDMQALAPLSHPKEMASSIDSLVQKVNKSKLYKNLFYNAFGDSLASGEKLLKSMSQFMLTLVSSNSKYDKVKAGKEVFNSQEQNGYYSYKKNCSACHTEPLFSNYEFANNGLKLDTSLKDYGRFSVTKNPNDSLTFKIPTLRNIEYTYPYMHDGRFAKLMQVINHYTSGIERNRTLHSKLQNPIVLTEVEKVDLISFLLTLSDREFLFNKKFAFPKEVYFVTGNK